MKWYADFTIGNTNPTKRDYKCKYGITFVNIGARRPAAPPRGVAGSAPPSAPPPAAPPTPPALQPRGDEAPAPPRQAFSPRVDETPARLQPCGG